MSAALDIGKLAAQPGAEELMRNLFDPLWRIENLYWILVKEPVKEDTPADEGAGKRVKFKMNRHQRRFLDRLWTRNIILKARQLGFTTLICLLWLDFALFNPDVRCGIIAQDEPTAKAIFRDKVKYAYENLPVGLRAVMPLKRDSADELLFDHNNSSVKVATSMRGGTLDRLHVSEFGKICAKYPDKAEEVITGSLPTVVPGGIAVIESTAEGRDGAFFDMTQLAQANHQQRLRLGEKDYRFHFFPWWDAEEYVADPSRARISDDDHDYFDRIEAEATVLMGKPVKILLDQRAWYVSTRDNDLVGREERMWQEYPSTPDEAFQVSTAGAYLAKEMVRLRRRGGITHVPVLDIPVYSFWDIGNTDGCGIWLIQRIKGVDRCVGYYENHGEDLRHYAKWLLDWSRDHRVPIARSYLPHDAAHRKLSDYNKTTEEMLNDLLIRPTSIVPPITDLQNGIQQLRACLAGLVIDEVACKDGVHALDGYRKKWNTALGKYIDTPDKTNGCTEGADALRQYAQANNLNMIPDATHFDPPAPRSRDEEPDEPDWRM